MTKEEVSLAILECEKRAALARLSFENGDFPKCEMRLKQLRDFLMQSNKSVSDFKILPVAIAQLEVDEAKVVEIPQ